LHASLDDGAARLSAKRSRGMKGTDTLIPRSFVKGVAMDMMDAG